jgi:hypothetical protein
MPKPSTVRKTPSRAFCRIRPTSWDWSVTPTLKSPSVQRITRFVPPRTKPFLASA